MIPGPLQHGESNFQGLTGGFVRANPGVSVRNSAHIIGGTAWPGSGYLRCPSFPDRCVAIGAKRFYFVTLSPDSHAKDKEIRREAVQTDSHRQAHAPDARIQAFAALKEHQVQTPRLARQAGCAGPCCRVEDVSAVRIVTREAAIRAVRILSSHGADRLNP